MVMRRSSKILVALGVLLLIAAAAQRFVIVPAISKLPVELDVRNRYAGVGTMLNPTALQAGDLTEVFVTDMPVSIDRHTYVSEAHGDTAIVHDNLTVGAPGGMSMPSNHTYAIDRTTMDSVSAPEGVEVEPHAGMTIGLPIHPDPNTNYQLYDSAIRASVPMNYIGTGFVSGRAVLNYTVDSRGQLTDTAVLGALPTALPKAQLTQLAPALPPEVQARFTPDVLAALPDPVPFTYTAATKFDLAFDKTLGTPLDGSIDQQVIASVHTDKQVISIAPVLALQTKLTAESISSAADTAVSTTRLLTIGSVLAPALLAIIGVILVALGIARRRTSTDRPNESTQSTDRIAVADRTTVDPDLWTS